MAAFLFSGQEALDKITEAVDTGNVTGLLDSVPEDARWLVTLAARKMRSVRSAAIDTLAYACEGRLAEAANTAGDVARYAGMAHDHLADAVKPKNERGRK